MLSRFCGLPGGGGGRNRVSLGCDCRGADEEDEGVGWRGVEAGWMASRELDGRKDVGSSISGSESDTSSMRGLDIVRG